MQKSRFNEAPIIGMIKEQEAGMPTAEVCRKHGLSHGTFYKFKSKYGAEARRAHEQFEGSALDALAQSKTGEYEIQTRKLSL